MKSEKVKFLILDLLKAYAKSTDNDVDDKVVADSTADKAAWSTYRTALRDLPSASGFPYTMTWPTEPSNDIS
jgi:hypothetical protein